MRDSPRKSTVPDSKQAGLTFFEHAMSLLQELKRTQADVIQKAAELCADRIARGGLVFLFGNGHSRMMSEEMTPRQGGYVGFVALVELASACRTVDCAATSWPRAPSMPRSASSIEPRD